MFHGDLGILPICMLVPAGGTVFGNCPLLVVSAFTTVLLVLLLCLLPTCGFLIASFTLLLNDVFFFTLLCRGAVSLGCDFVVLLEGLPFQSAV